MNIPLRKSEETAELEQAVKTGRFSVFSSITALIVAVACLGVIVVSTQPARGGPAVILIVLLLFFLLFLGISLGLISLIVRFFKITSFSRAKKLYMTVLLASGAVLLLGLQTLNQLQLIDFILVTIFEVLLNFYITRRF